MNLFFDHTRIKIGIIKILMKITTVMTNLRSQMKIILFMRRNQRVGIVVKVHILLNLKERASHTMYLVDKEEERHHLMKMSPQQRTLRVTVMRVLKAQEGKVHISAKVMFGQPMSLDEMVMYELLLDLFGRCHMLKVKVVMKRKKAGRKSHKK